jgi:hypothetical protein
MTVTVVVQMGTMGRLDNASLQGVILYHEGTMPVNLIVYEQMDLSHDELD